MVRTFILASVLSTGFLSCSDHSSYENENGSISGAKVYKAHCTICHGEDGRKGFANSSILPESELSEKERILVIANGRGTMSAYKNVLTDKELEAVAQYTLTLK